MKKSATATGLDDDEIGPNLLKAVESGDIEKARELASKAHGGQLSAIAVNYQDVQGRTPLAQSVRRGDLGLVTFLVSQMNIDLNQVDEDDRTPLHHAVLIDCREAFPSQEHTEPVGASHDDEATKSRPNQARSLGHSSSAPSLSVSDATVGTGIGSSRGPKKQTFIGGPIVRLIARAGANLEVKDKNSFTPLMLASMYGVSEAVKDLLETGAKVTVKNDVNGWTSLDFARKGRYCDGRRKVAGLIGEWSTIRQKKYSRLEDFENLAATKWSNRIDSPHQKLVGDLDLRCSRFEVDLKKDLGHVSGSVYTPSTYKPSVDVCNEVELLVHELQRDASLRLRAMARLRGEEDDDFVDDDEPENPDFPSQKAGYHKSNKPFGKAQTALNKKGYEKTVVDKTTASAAVGPVAGGRSNKSLRKTDSKLDLVEPSQPGKGQTGGAGARKSQRPSSVPAPANPRASTITRKSKAQNVVPPSPTAGTRGPRASKERLSQVPTLVVPPSPTAITRDARATTSPRATTSQRPSQPPASPVL